VNADPRTAARMAVQQRPRDAMAWVELSDFELDAGDLAAGERAARHALSLAPGHPEALARLGRAAWMRGDAPLALRSLRAAHETVPTHPGFAVWYAHLLEEFGDAEDAAAMYAHAHALAPGDAQIADCLLAWRRRLCDWRGLDALSQQVRAAVRDGSASPEPFAFLSEDATPGEQLRCARLRALQVAQSTPQMPPAPAVAAAAPVRAGFLSNGFGAHPTGLLTAAMFESMRRLEGLEVSLFALDRDDGSDIRRRLAAASCLVDVSADDHARIAQRIRDAGIEVLVDLRGWGGGGVPGVFARRPAPVQVNWLAFPATSGAPWIDYIIADRYVVPAERAGDFSEALAWLPRCFQPSDTRRAIPPSPTRGDCGLPAQGVVFCCFNNSYKLNPGSMARAFAVLRAVPGSVLWLLSGPGRADERLREAAAASGVESLRLVFMRKQPHADYLARLRLADLFLDTGPYNAHTTASDALWAGCPVLTTPGATFASRVAGSLNHHLGLGAMNVADDEAFVRLAVELATAPGALAALRSDLASRRDAAALFDMPGFAADFAALLRRMAARSRAGLPPAALEPQPAWRMG
jgi:predicted O-linked N-acetylglucosamine transferase (SPINDLY family)